MLSLSSCLDGDTLGVTREKDTIFSPPPGPSTNGCDYHRAGRDIGGGGARQQPQEADEAAHRRRRRARPGSELGQHQEG